MVKKISFSTFIVVLISLMVGVASPGSTARADDNSRYFPETGHTVSGKFLDYWTNNGGLSSFGYPITDAQNEVDSETGNYYLTQWFERNRFELHPEFAGTKYEVELGLLGKRLTSTRIINDPTFQPTSPVTGFYYFPQTKHNVSSLFYSFWQNNGSLDLLGFPIDEQQKEVDPATGKTFLIQWFERARVEFHPENPAPYNVELGLLGREIKDFTPGSLLNTYYITINSKSFQQAYNYWESPQRDLPPFNNWVQGYANTAFVTLITGQYRVDVGAGNAYAGVPVVLLSTQNDNSKQVFYGCYITHRVNIQPDSPWRISRAIIKQDTTGANTNTLLANATTICANP